MATMELPTSSKDPYSTTDQDAVTTSNNLLTFYLIKSPDFATFNEFLVNLMILQTYFYPSSLWTFPHDQDVGRFLQKLKKHFKQHVQVLMMLRTTDAQLSALYAVSVNILSPLNY